MHRTWLKKDGVAMVASTHPLISATWAAPRLLHKPLGILTEGFPDPRKEAPGCILSHLQFPWLLRATMRSPLRSPAQVEGTQGTPRATSTTRSTSASTLSGRKRDNHADTTGVVPRAHGKTRHAICHSRVPARVFMGRTAMQRAVGKTS